VLPVLAHAGWQVETVSVDLGTGLREWIEIRHGDEIAYAATVAKRDVLLRDHGINPADLTAVETINDGCE
jgi:hypothetical protein